jgi:hypothetical protein
MKTGSHPTAGLFCGMSAYICFYNRRIEVMKTLEINFKTHDILFTNFGYKLGNINDTA